MNDFHPIANYMHSFFYQYLSGAKGLSSNTILSYRDSLKLFLCFSADQRNKTVDQLTIEDLDEKTVLAFLDNIEKERGNSPNTRNGRLAAIRSFFSFIGREEPSVLAQCHKIRTIPIKKIEHKHIECLDTNETQAIFDSIDLQSRTGIRDNALLLVLYNTGARVQEIVNLTINDLRLDLPGQVKILGKGKKQRICPLWPETIDALKSYFKKRGIKNPNERVFLNANGKPITRFGIRHTIKHYTQKALHRCHSLKHKSVGPHTWRHTTAMDLLRAGNDINMVKIWLGHADINTTHAYIEIDMEMKRKILNSNSAPVSNNTQNNSKEWHKPDVIEWLENLSKEYSTN
ncbi:MAG: integrase [Thermodesulfobacteriota bacterium]|nr:MAG: integrase [Thermodesulfobacteriota bacterium]